MNTRLTANLSILFTSILTVLSFSFGFHKYSETKKMIISDLNEALQQTLMQNAQTWMGRDTIKSYIHLSNLFGNPISIESYNRDFAAALALSEIKEKSGIRVRVKNKKKPGIPKFLTNKNLSAGYLTSDTVLWLSASTGSGPDSMQNDIGVSFQGYTDCSGWTIFSLTDKTWPGLFLFSALLSGICSFYLIRKKRQTGPSDLVCAENSIAYGNLTFFCEQSMFYLDNRDMLRLTPQQYTLMEMFFLAPAHVLTRAEICEVLWPGKINADETLNTLIRRLRGLIETQTNLKITTDRGRAYILEIAEKQTA